ncbi:MAG: DUF6261 family protein [Prevotellaceae bacterium]|jgi:hypothetical protein|nr:DUF6261 family protein [Prevotellaceae bacterium]
MKVNSMNTTAMNNGAHFRYMEETVTKAESDPVISRNFSVQLAALKKALAEEDKALKLSTKSLLSDDIYAADRRRDSVYSALVKAVHGFRNVPGLEQPARVVGQAFIDYSIKSGMQRDKKSGLMSNLLNDLLTKYTKEVAQLGLNVMIDSLQKANQEVIDLMSERTDEQKNHAKGALKAARLLTDKAYHDFIDMLNARALTEGTTKYDDFMTYMNAEILHYQREVLHQKGNSHSSDTPSGDTGGEDDGEEEPPQG